MSYSNEAYKRDISGYEQDAYQIDEHLSLVYPSKAWNLPLLPPVSDSGLSIVCTSFR